MSCHLFHPWPTVKNQTHSAVPSVSSSVSSYEETGILMLSDIGIVSKQGRSTMLQALKEKAEDQAL